MSKTVRRKKVADHTILRDFCMDFLDNDCISLGIPCTLDCPYRDKKRTISRYRRDTHVGYGLNAPKSSRKIVNREKRAKMKAEARRILIQGDYDEYSFDKWVHDAGWWCL